MLKIPSMIKPANDSNKKVFVTLDRSKLKNPWTFCVFKNIKRGGVFRCGKYFWEKFSDCSARKKLDTHIYGISVQFPLDEKTMTFKTEIKIVEIPKTFTSPPEVSQ